MATATYQDTPVLQKTGVTSFGNFGSADEKKNPRMETEQAERRPSADGGGNPVRPFLGVFINGKRNGKL